MRQPYSPPPAAAFSVNSDPSRMYRRNIVVPLWPVVLAMTLSGTPAAAADVASPARGLCPTPSRDRCPPPRPIA